jgi:hypothetical protein
VSKHIDGTFYWVKGDGEWTVGQYFDDPGDYHCGFRTYDEYHLVREEHLDEIGPLIGKQPPGVEREAIVLLLEEELRDAAWYGDNGIAAFTYVLSRIRDGQHLEPIVEGRSA